MSTIVTLSGSPSAKSRSHGLLTRASRLLESYGITIRAFTLGDFDAETLLYGKFDDPAVIAFQKAVADADGLIVATPVYKAAYSGALKLLLDLLPERALHHHAVLPLATGGSPSHMLAVDYALQPVLTSLKARHIVGGIYATERELTWRDDGYLELAPEIEQRLTQAVSRLLAHLPDPGQVLLHPDQLNQQIRGARISV
ncbi:NADPH-dependent FMN reductase [Jeongeupia wiesaeckerbachi]|uniref:NADPH-dependent FMN reductase n=1 Tax=Jeongeupia wiesaeckerbachi TaxID=3051218 RepID=UPI003D800BCA